MKITINTEINASADKVWKILAHDFENAHEWMASVPSSFGKELAEKLEGSHSAGRVCELDNNPKGIKAYENIEAYNEDQKTMQVRIYFRNTPPVFPIKYNVANFEIQSLEDDRCRFLFRVNVNLALMGYILYPLLRFGFPVILRQVNEELKFFAENGTPHPRKMKALTKLENAQLTA